MLPLSPPDWLAEGHCAYFIAEIVDMLEVDSFYARYGGGGRRISPCDPRMLLKVLARRKTLIRIWVPQMPVLHVVFLALLYAEVPNELLNPGQTASEVGPYKEKPRRRCCGTIATCWRGRFLSAAIVGRIRRSAGGVWSASTSGMWTSWPG